MPRNYDCDEPDHFESIDEDDRDSRYYEYLCGGPEDEEWQTDKNEDSLDKVDLYPHDFEHFKPSLPVPQPGDETAARHHFAVLKRKYRAESCRDTSPICPLFEILIKLESMQKLDSVNLGWLYRNRLIFPIRIDAERKATEFQKQFEDFGYGWDAVSASSWWRKAEQPAKALAVTAWIDNKDHEIDAGLAAALLTTRGGAFRDQANLTDAEVCGQQAIQHEHSKFHPYMLLGAVYYQMGNPQKGDEYFAIARSKGAKSEDEVREIRAAVKRAGEVEQRKVAAYLLQKDPVKYNWAQKYLL